MYCPKCGTKNSNSAIFCIKCGNKIIEEDIETSENEESSNNIKELSNPDIKPNDIENSISERYNSRIETKKNNSIRIGENYESTLRAYVGKNSDYYINQFKSIEENEKTNINWTWLIGGLWLLYRKMYAYFFLTLIPIANIYFIFNLIFNSNKIYYKFICKKIEKDKMAGEDLENYEVSISLAKKHGGISYVGVAISLVVSILIPTVIYISIMAYISSLNNDDFTYSYNDLTDFEDDGSTENNFNDYISSNILYNELPITELFALSIDSVDNWLGERTFDGYYAGGRTYGYYDEIFFAFDENTREIIAILSSPDALSVNGQTLDKNQAELTVILGRSTDEGWSVDGMDEDHYYMTYEFGVFNLNISLPKLDEKAYEIFIYRDSNDY